MILVRLIMSQLVFVLFGGFLHTLLFRRSKSRIPFWERGGVIYLLGLGGLGFCLFLIGFLGMRLTLGIILILAFLAGAGWIVLRRSEIKGLFEKRHTTSRFLPQRLGKLRTVSCVEMMLLGGLLVNVALQFQYTFGLPMMGFDSRAHWALKSKILHHEKTFYSESFYDSERIHPQVRHPLLLPITQVVVTQSLGVYDDRLMKLPFFLIFVSLLFLMYSELRRYYSRATALCFLLLLATLPQFATPTDGGITSGYADAPMALYFLCTMIFFVRWLQLGNLVHLSLAALFAIFTMYFKDEGIGYVVSAMGALLLSLLVFKKGAWGKKILMLLLFIGLMILFLCPAKIYSNSLSVGKGEYFESILNLRSVRKNIGQLAQILSSYRLEMIFNLPHWGILWIFLIFSMIYNVKRFRVQEVLFVGLTLLFSLCVLTVIFIVLPWDLAQFFAGSLGRLILHLSLIAVYLIALLWKERMSENSESLKLANHDSS